MNTVICMKWGTRYGAEYVNTLAAMVRRHLSLPYRFVCFTDDQRGIRPDVETFPLPEMHLNESLPERGWRKLSVFQPQLADLTGQALFLDLDVVILSSLDDFFTVPGHFRIIRDWNLPGTIIGNSSVFRFEIGRHPDILTHYLTHGDDVRRQHRNEQAYLSHAMHAKAPLEYWPAAWCRSFKTHCMRPVPFSYFLPAKHPGPETKIVIFHGKPNPDQIRAGWHSSNFLRAVRPPEWFLENWQE